MFPLNPREVPVQYIDTSGRTLPAGLLNPSSLREACLGLPHWSPELRGELPVNGGALVPSAVLVGLMMRDQPTLLLTRRSQHLHDHPGQISFPGGRVEDRDPDALATALREAQEEVGVPPEKVRHLGCLPEYTTGTGFAITPVVCLIDPCFQPRLDPSEVDELFEVPLEWILTPSNHRRHEVDAAGRRRTFWSMQWQRNPSDGASRDYFIWGATAAMIRNFYCFLMTATP